MARWRPTMPPEQRVVRLYFIFVVLSLLTQKSHGNHSENQCPLTCKCKHNSDTDTELDVFCEDRNYWNKIPPLPTNTTYFEMMESNITVLRQDSFNKISRRILRRLSLHKDNISSVKRTRFGISFKLIFWKWQQIN